MKVFSTSLIFLASIIVLTSSCQKSIEPDPLKILTGKPWQMDEIRYIQNNKIYYYKRGESGNNVSYDDAYIKFNQDGTGNTQWQGNFYNLTWNFVNPEKTKITYTIQNGASLLVTWEGVTYSESIIKYTEYYTNNNINSLAQASRTPKNI